MSSSLAHGQAVALTMCSSAGMSLDRGVAYYDVTRPSAPKLLGRYHADSDVVHADGVPPPAGTPIFSNNGCRPFSAGHGAGFSHDGQRALVAYYDGGIFTLDLDGAGMPVRRGQFTYPDDRRFEGSAAYVASARVDGRDLALISEADFIAPTTTLIIDGPASVAGPKVACESIFTLYDPANKAQLYRQPTSRIDGDLAYVGRGCPVSRGLDVMHSDMAAAKADLYLADVRGRIALIDRSRQPIQKDLPEGPGCSVAERVKRAQDEGARAVVILQTSATAPQAFSPDGDPAGVRIPVIMIDKGDGDTLRTLLCPSLEHGRSAPLCAAASR